jgi:hypothetical protein
MEMARRTSQQGLSFTGFLFGAFALVLVMMIGLKLIPAYMQDAEIKKMFNVISGDPDMQKASLREIRASFGKRASIDNITAIKPEDIEIQLDSGRPVLSASYTVIIPLAGNVSLSIAFNPASASK